MSLLVVALALDEQRPSPIANGRSASFLLPSLETVRSARCRDPWPGAGRLNRQKLSNMWFLLVSLSTCQRRPQLVVTPCCSQEYPSQTLDTLLLDPLQMARNAPGRSTGSRPLAGFVSSAPVITWIKTGSCWGRAATMYDFN